MSTVAVHRTPVRTAVRPAARPAPQRVREHADGPVRLTRRGRLVVRGALVVLVLAVLAVGAVLAGASTVATSEAGAPAVARTVTIQPGQTLWDLARQAAPQADPRTVVDDIVELNALTGGGDVQPGQKVSIPRY